MTLESAGTDPGRSLRTSVFLIAWFLGPTALGLYSLAFRVPQLTHGMLAQVGRVVLPTFARLQDDPERLARAFLDIMQCFALAIVPGMALAVLAAPIGVPAIFGAAWTGAVVPLQLIAAMTVPYTLVTSMGPLTVAVGRADWEFHWSLVSIVASLVALPIGLLWGIVGVAAAFLIMSIVLAPIRFVIIQRLIPISAGGYLRALAPAFASSAVLAVVWLLAEALLQAVMSGLVLIAVVSVAGAAAYLAAFRLAWPDDFRRQLDFRAPGCARKSGMSTERAGGSPARRPRRTTVSGWAATGRPGPGRRKPGLGCTGAGSAGHLPQIPAR